MYLKDHLSNPSEATIISFYIQWLTAVYEIDPSTGDQLTEGKIMVLLEDLMKEHVMGICEQIFKSNNQPLKLQILYMLENICLE